MSVNKRLLWNRIHTVDCDTHFDDDVYRIMRIYAVKCFFAWYLK